MVAFHANRTPSTFLSGMWTQLGVNSHGQRVFFFVVVFFKSYTLVKVDAKTLTLMGGS